MPTIVQRAACAVLLTAATPALAAAAGNINVFGGVKALDQDVWTPVENQAELGVEMSFGGTGWPVWLAVDAFQSTDEADEGVLERKGTTRELALGVRKIWERGNVRPYIGGGVTRIEAEVETTSPPPPAAPGLSLLPEPDPDGGTVSEDDAATGIWAGGGVFWRLGSHFNLGISARFSGAKVTIRGDEEQAGGLHGGVVLGFGWPASQ